MSNTRNLVQFDKASVISRFFTVLAGPLANFLFSIFIFSLLILIQGISVKDPIVGKINKFYEEKYDLRVNDKILKVEGKEVKSFSEIFSYINEPQKQSSKFTIKRGSVIQEIELPYLMQPVIEAIEPLSAASLAGLEVGDVFIEVNKKKLTNFNDLREEISRSDGRVLPITIFRNGQVLKKSIRPVLSPIEDLNGDYSTAYRIGVAGGPIFYPHRLTPSVGRAVLLGAETTIEVIKASLRGIKGIISGQVDPKYLSGPIGIAHAISDSIKSGVLTFLSLVAIISTGIGIVNLLPIPILDGGHIMLLFYEYFFKKKPTEDVLRFAMIFGLGLLLSLLLFTTFNDISRLLLFLKY